MFGGVEIPILKPGGRHPHFQPFLFDPVPPPAKPCTNGRSQSVDDPPLRAAARRDGARARADAARVAAASCPIALGLGAVTLGYYFFGPQATRRVLATAHEYAGFIALVGSLFVVSGGIHLGVKCRATPLANTVFLLAGALLANVLGTTGAAMLLIRPWLRMNQNRIAAHHLVFFIFLVANVGGCLTPVGDPPLFLGYLQGVPFWWVAKNCWPMWAVGVGLLLAIFYVLDRINFSRAPRAAREKEAATETWSWRRLAEFVFPRRHSRRGVRDETGFSARRP